MGKIKNKEVKDAECNRVQSLYRLEVPRRRGVEEDDQNQFLRLPFQTSRVRHIARRLQTLSGGGKMLKTMWNGVSVRSTPQGMLEKHRCSACPSQCFLTISILEEPPEICTKEVTNAEVRAHDLRQM